MSEKQSYYVGAKAIVAYKDGVLLLKDEARDKWELPGGRVDANQTIEEAIKRELGEELPGTELIRVGQVIHTAIGDFTVENDHKLLLVFYSVRASLPEEIELSHEHNDFAVVTPKNLESFDMYSSDKTALKKYFKQSKPK